MVDGEELGIYTSRLEIHYNRKPFAANGLTIKVNGEKGGWGATWHFGDEPEDLGGTARTLDMCDGPMVINARGLRGSQGARRGAIYRKASHGARTDVQKELLPV